MYTREAARWPFSGRVLKRSFMLDYLLQLSQPSLMWFKGIVLNNRYSCIVWILSIPGGILMAMLRLSKLPLVDKFVCFRVFDAGAHR